MATSLKGVVSTLQRELGRAFYVVGRPDHPMLLSGPDILIGGEGKLTAVVSVRKHEATTRLLARITAARLALPPQTRLLAIVAEDAVVPQWVMGNFDEVADPRRAWQTVRRYAASDASPRGDLGALKENKRRHSEKFAFALRLATLRSKHELDTVAPNVVMQELAQVNQELQRHSENALRLRRPMAQVQGSVVASISARGKPMEQLRTLCDASFTHAYQLDTGIPYEKPDANLNILLIEDWPIVRFDPEKPLRSAAFGCWILAKSSGSSDIANLIERSRDPKHMRKWQNA
ncbi:hypothetical protein [Acidovorax sp.]|uniref:hypothetical protein n=1 Tax=Acidovorax sp. TaxID=1872122 RepID=UPI00391F3E1C